MLSLRASAASTRCRSYGARRGFGRCGYKDFAPTEPFLARGWADPSRSSPFSSGRSCRNFVGSLVSDAHF
jgi:hypothetical protein